MKVFITYSRAQREPVNNLVEDLEKLSHSVWYDYDLRGGQSWWDNILANIRDCDVYVYAITTEALNSTACKREMKYAEALNKHALPVLIEKEVSIAMLPRYLSNIQFVDYTESHNKDSLIALINSLNNLPANPPLPDPLPDPPLIPISYLDQIKEKIESPSLSKDEQLGLVSDLKNRLADQEYKRTDVIDLFHMLRKRDDMLAFIAADIDTIIKADPVPSPVRQTQPVQSNPVKTSQQPDPQYSNPIHAPNGAPKAGGGWSLSKIILVIVILIILLIVILSKLTESNESFY